MADDVTLTDFLLARIAEREAVARRATPGPWRVCAEGSEGSRFAPDCEDKRQRSRFIGIANGRVQPEDGYNATHIVLNDPAYVLAECEAKRQIVELHGARVVYRGDWSECVVCFDPDASSPGDFQMETSPCPTLRALATVYADHPDYQEEWRP